MLAVVVGGLLLDGPTAEARRLNAITEVAVSQDVNGTTVVRVTGSAAFREGDFRMYHILQTPPRAVVRLSAAKAAFDVGRIPVGDGNVVRIRVSENPTHDPPELSLVFELAAHDVRVGEVALEGRQLVVRLTAGAGPHSATATAASVPSPTRTLPVMPLAGVATPIWTPTATELATATPIERPTATPTATPTRRPTPSPTATPVPQPSPTARPRAGRSRETRRVAVAASTPGVHGPTVLYRAPSPPAPSPTSSSGGGPAPWASAIAEIVVSQRSNDATLLRITLTEPIGARRIRHRRDPLDPLRHELVIQGVELASVPSSIEVERPNLAGLELAELQDGDIPQLRITLLLSSEAVVVDKIALLGSHLVVALETPSTP